MSRSRERVNNVRLGLKFSEFQQEVMARQIRFYRARHQQIRAVIEKLRSENSELKRTNEELAQENNQLKQQFGYQDSFSEGGQESSYTFNQNGKRPMGVPVYQHEYPSNRPRTGSSPHHGSTTPTRLTLPVNPRTSKLTHQNEGQAHPPVPQPLHGTIRNNTRPMSRQIGKFAYIPPDTSHTPSTSLSHAQMAPKLIRPSQLNRAGRNDSVTTNAQPQVVQQRTQASQHTAAQQGQPRNMGPPPVPQARVGTPAVTAGIPRQSNTLSRRFVPLQHSQRPQPSTSHGSQRFFPGASQSSSVASGSWSKSTTSDSAGRSAGASYG